MLPRLCLVIERDTVEDELYRESETSEYDATCRKCPKFLPGSGMLPWRKDPRNTSCNGYPECEPQRCTKITCGCLSLLLNKRAHPQTNEKAIEEPLETTINRKRVDEIPGLAQDMCRR